MQRPDSAKGKSNDPDQGPANLKRLAKMDHARSLGAASAGPRAAQQQILILDSVVHNMKHKRLKCRSAIEQAEQQLKLIASEENRINERYIPLKQEMEKKKELRRQIKLKIEQCQVEISQILDYTLGHINRARSSMTSFGDREASFSLKLSRGYTFQSHRNKKALTTIAAPSAFAGAVDLPSGLANSSTQQSSTAATATGKPIASNNNNNLGKAPHKHKRNLTATHQFVAAMS